MASKTQIYKVSFLNHGKIYEIYAKQVRHESLLGFVEIEGLLFGEKSGVVVDPTEEKLQAEFAGVKRTYVPIQAIIRIDEVLKQGSNKILPVSEKAENVTPFPTSLITPKRDPG